jgi:hypothetical protein
VVAAFIDSESFRPHDISVPWLIRRCQRSPECSLQAKALGISGPAHPRRTPILFHSDHGYDDDEDDHIDQSMRETLRVRRWKIY